MAEPSRREDERESNRKGEKRGADGEFTNDEAERAKRRREQGAGNSRVDLGYIEHLEAHIRRTAPSPEEKRGADGEFTRERAVKALKRKREEGVEDTDAELHYIDQLQTHITRIEHAKGCPRCGRPEKELATQDDPRKQERNETTNALGYL